MSIKRPGSRSRQGRLPLLHVAGPPPYTSIALSTVHAIPLLSPGRYARRSGDVRPGTAGVAAQDAGRPGDSSLGPKRFVVRLLGFFAVVALLLAALGLYGVISYSVSQSTQELGIRAALGAPREAVLRLVVGTGRPVGGGGRRNRAGGLARRQAVDEEPAIRGQRLRSSHLCVDGAAAGGRGVGPATFPRAGPCEFTPRRR